MLQNLIAVGQPTPEISVTKVPCGQKNRKTSTPVVRTGVYPHMPIAVTANSLQHWPSLSKRRPVSQRSETVGQVCRTRLTSGERVIDSSIFDLGGLPLGPRSPKGEMTWRTLRSTSLQNFIALCQPTPEISVTKVPADTKNKQ